MSAGFLTLLLCVGGAPQIDAQMFQVGPPHPEETYWRTPGQTRAVILIHGLRIHPISEARAAKPELSHWEKPDATIVKALSKHADVFAFCYGQNAPLDDIAKLPVLADSVRRLQKMEYREIIFVGYSAGGLIARQYVEDAPNGGGVTKVIQVCPPNGGSSWTVLSSGVRQAQEPFVRSLTKEARETVRQ